MGKSVLSQTGGKPPPAPTDQGKRSALVWLIPRAAIKRPSGNALVWKKDRKVCLSQWSIQSLHSTSTGGSCHGPPGSVLILSQKQATDIPTFCLLSNTRVVLRPGLARYALPLAHSTGRSQAVTTLTAKEAEKFSLACAREDADTRSQCPTAGFHCGRSYWISRDSFLPQQDTVTLFPRKSIPNSILYHKVQAYLRERKSSPEPHVVSHVQ